MSYLSFVLVLFDGLHYLVNDSKIFNNDTQPDPIKFVCSM